MILVVQAGRVGSIREGIEKGSLPPRQTGARIPLDLRLSRRAGVRIPSRDLRLSRRAAVRIPFRFEIVPLGQGTDSP